MKKQFFYAALAVALMASCTSEDNLAVDPVNPTPEEEAVSLNLGIEAPSVNAAVGGRGTGSVGDVEGANNKWNNQKLYITMIDRKTGNVAMNGTEEIMAWDSYDYIAPRAADQNPTADDVKGNIRFYETGTYEDSETDKGTIKYLYYPVNGRFDFYGWHLDGTAIEPVISATPESDANKYDGNASIALSGITIDGTQDIMAATTTDRSADLTVTANNLLEWLYSARTARNEVHPVLKFEHKLARLKFFVRAGSDATALKNADNSYTAADPKVTGDHTSTGAMYVTGIRALNMVNQINMTLEQTGTAATAVADAFGEFALGDKLLAEYAESTKKVGEIDTLVAVAPEYNWNYTSKPTEYVGTPVGESIMFLPSGDSETKLEFEMDLKQYLQLTDDETSANQDEWGYKSQEDAKFTVYANHVKLDGVAQTKFEPGKSYNIYITIYGFERIEVSAELTPWVLGGDVEVDIENGESK